MISPQANLQHDGNRSPHPDEVAAAARDLSRLAQLSERKHELMGELDAVRAQAAVICLELNEAGVSISEIARTCGVTRQYVQQRIAWARAERAPD